jgi:hypothetical protein
MFYATAIKMPAGSTKHEHIGALRWLDCSKGTADTSAMSIMVDWVAKNPGKLRVADAKGSVEVRAVRPSGRDPYLRTYADDRPTDNLLDLPRL